MYNVGMKNTSTLSVVLATHNEAHTIERCLRSVYEIADEIVIVDGESDDQTVDVARKHDPKKKLVVISTKNLKNFHIMKQQAIDTAKSEWILQIDADEELSDKLAGEIAQLISQDKSSQPNLTAHGYWMPRLNYFLGKPLHKGGQYPDKTLRLYKNGYGRLPCKNIHEQAEVDGPVGNLNNDLLHYPYPNFGVYVDKWMRYSSLEATRSYKKGLRPSVKNTLIYCIWKPKIWFLATYFRHKGFQDGIPGFMFSLFSALRFVAEYALIYEMSHSEKK